MEVTEEGCEEVKPGAEQRSGLGRACPDPHVLACFSAQGLRCYECIGVASESSCRPTTCSYPNAVCVTQEVESTMGEFPVACMKLCSGVAWEEIFKHLWAIVLCGP